MNPIRTRILFLFMLVLAGAGSFAQIKKISVQSPDKKIALSLSIQNNQLYYQVSFKGKEVIQPSVMGLKINEIQIGAANSIRLVGKSSINEKYASRGVHSTALYKANTLNVAVSAANVKNNFNVEAQVFNDGIAFRYVVQNTANSKVNEDLTEFSLPENSIVWWQGDIGAYEGEYRKTNIADIKAGQKVGPPLTIQLPDQLGYAAITEAGLTDFAGLSLIAKGNRTYKAHLTGNTNKTGAIESSWRVIEIGSDLNALVNSDIISNVSSKPDARLFPQGPATDWIKPGMSVWSWLAGNGDVTFENMKKFSNWAGQLGIAYNLVDEGWSRWNDGGKDKWTLIKELVDYSAKQHVKIWVWKAYPDRNGVPGLKNEVARKTFFKACKDAGVVGLKIDFFDEESQEVIDFYQAALKDAAEMQLMLDFHGANKPTGESRTWPNEMSREGIRGLENGTPWPKHNSTLPFTRYLAGHGDYTPLSFRNIVKGTTVVHQIATVAAFTSPFLCLAVNPEALLVHPAKNMVTSIPVVWDETIVLPQSKIGELYLVARRSGKTWFLMALNGDSKQTVSVDLSFLGKGKYKASGLKDKPEHADQFLNDDADVNHNSKLNISLEAGGGYISKIVIE